MKVLYYYSKLNIGGAERSTVRLLNKMVQKGHSVTLLLRWDGGLLERELNPTVRVIHLKKDCSKSSRLVRTLNMAVQTGLMYSRQLKLKTEKYDLVISGLFGYDPLILFKYISGKKYCQMLRNDVGKTGQYGKTKEYMEQYGGRFHSYVGVSEYTTESFRKVYPQFADRAMTIYNILPEVDASAVREIPKLMLGVEQMKILTVCRLTDQAKGLFRMVSICARLKERYQGQFRWYIVGSGPDEEELKQRIIANGLQDTMILCGKTADPFAYYAACDLVAVLSYYEGLCGVVNEAKIMSKPVIATEFSGIYEQITSGENGIVVGNGEEEIFSAMCDILDNPESIRAWAVNDMPQNLLDNDRKIEQFEEIVEGA